ncbi:MAG: PqiC family protein, partial [Burkholderiales bacterium]
MGRYGAVMMLCALTVVAAGCASTPPAHFYTLSATATRSSTSSSVSVAVGPVSVPAVVDRPEIIISTGDNEVQLDEFNRWASPLQDNLARVIAENLVAI